MTEAQLLEQLAHLGIDEMNFRALPLLPLIQVAWSDGEIQAAERALIVALAIDKWGLREEGQLQLGNWLQFPPTEAYFRRGQQALVALAARERGMALDESTLGDVNQLAQDVAKAAGGLFGFGAVSRDEQAALTQIAAALSVPADADLSAVQAIDEAFGAPERRGRVTLTLNTAQIDVGSNEAVVIPDIDPTVKVPIGRSGIVIGGNASCDIQLDYDRAVNGLHCRLIEQNRSYYCIDLGSDAGTWVNGERIVQRRLLGGEALRIGSTMFTFKWLKRVDM